MSPFRVSSTSARSITVSYNPVRGQSTTDRALNFTQSNNVRLISAETCGFPLLYQAPSITLLSEHVQLNLAVVSGQNCDRTFTFRDQLRAFWLSLSSAHFNCFCKTPSDWPKRDREFGGNQLSRAVIDCSSSIPA